MAKVSSKPVMPVIPSLSRVTVPATGVQDTQSHHQDRPLRSSCHTAPPECATCRPLLSPEEAEVLADLLVELADASRDEDLGELARMLAIRLYHRVDAQE